MKYLHFVVLLSFYITSVRSEIFVCPDANIELASGINGVLPIGATENTIVPKGINCTIKFDVPTGFAVQLDIVANYEPSIGDYVKFEDSFYISPTNGTTEFGLGPTLSLEVLAVSTKFTFFANYSFVDMTKYTRTVVSTGDYFLATLASMKYYTIKSAAGDTVSAKTSMRNTGFFDQQIHDVFVFDGNDIINSSFIGRLGNIYRDFDHSTTDTLSFVNLYETESNTFIMGNDYSRIAIYDHYRVLIVDSKVGFNGYMTYDRLPGLTAYTYICDGCSQFYINSMTFDMKVMNASYGFVEFRGMSPTQNMPILVNYTANDFSPSQLPLYIPSRMATAILHDGSIAVDVKTSKQGVDSSAQNQNTGTIISPTLWNPNDEASFNYTVSSKTVDLYEFLISFSKIVFADDKDQLEIVFRDEKGAPTFQKLYNSKNIEDGNVKGSGATMTFDYSGSKDSQIIINFERTSLTTTTVNDVTGSSSTSTFSPTTSSSSTSNTTNTTPLIQDGSSTISAQTSSTPQPMTSQPISSTNYISTSTVQATTSGSLGIPFFTGIIATIIFNWNVIL